MIGKTLSHYKIIEQIGAGGMGVVYRAMDERLERDVALKVLPSDALTDEDARRRFRKEALALSKLNHPNIATVFDFDHQEGVDFLAMELIAGESLAEKLAHGSLSEKEVAALGGQIAAALEEAHEHGVVHRDLKPGNVMVTPKGQVKVLDFGLAKLLNPLGDAELTRSVTETKAVAGTVPYMAPEQLRNETLDARTDIHALGAVLFEMATGKRAFAEESSPRLTDAILHRPPVSARSLNPRISPELDRIILKCLEKEPENRYQSAKEVAVDLRRLASPPSATASAPALRATWRLSRVALTAGIVIVAIAVTLVAFNVGGARDRLLGRAGPPKIESIAVLPLANLSGDPEQEYFADGMTEAIITELAQISGLKKVTSRTSVMLYKQNKKSMPEIAKELGVDAIIEGSVQRAGDKVGITVQLIDPAADRHLWAKSYERDARDILSLQREVARAIAGEIRVRLTPQEQTRLTGIGRVNPEAHDAYLQGRYHWNRRTTEELETAVQFFNRAIALDPTYAPAYAGLADSYALLGGAVVGSQVPRDVMPRAKAAAKKALEIDPGLAEAHTSLVFTALFYDWDWDQSEREFKLAIERNPNYATAHHWYSFSLASRGQTDQALAEMKRAQQLDPLSPVIDTMAGWPLFIARKYDQAIEQYRNALRIAPDFLLAHFFMGVAYQEKGMPPEAFDEFQKASTISAGTPEMVAALGYAYARSGKRREALRVLEKLRELAKHTYVSPYSEALIYTGLGDKDRAMEWLDKAYQERAGSMVWVKVDPRFDTLRSDPRFQELVQRMKFPESGSR